MPCATGCGAPATDGSFCEACAPPWHARFHAAPQVVLRPAAPAPVMPRPFRRAKAKRVFAEVWS